MTQLFRIYYLHILELQMLSMRVNELLTIQIQSLKPGVWSSIASHIGSFHYPPSDLSITQIINVPYVYRCAAIRHT